MIWLQGCVDCIACEGDAGGGSSSLDAEGNHLDATESDRHFPGAKDIFFQPRPVIGRNGDNIVLPEDRGSANVLIVVVEANQAGRYCVIADCARCGMGIGHVLDADVDTFNKVVADCASRGLNVHPPVEGAVNIWATIDMVTLDHQPVAIDSLIIVGEDIKSQRAANQFVIQNREIICILGINK